MRMRYQVGLLLAFGCLFAAFACNPPKLSGDWASWVQAWGSIAAICAAIWVAFDQHAKIDVRVRQQEAQELRNFLSGVREELLVHWEIYQDQVGRDLEAHPEGEPFLNWWPLPPDPFKFFKASIEKIGKIQNDELRGHLIRVNVVVEGLLATYQTHNILLNKLEENCERFLESQNERHREVANGVERQLTDYSKSLIEHHHYAKERIGSAIALIDSELEAPSQQD